MNKIWPDPWGHRMYLPWHLNLGLHNKHRSQWAHVTDLGILLESMWSPGLYQDFPRTVEGLYMDCAWTVHGLHMDSIRSHHQMANSKSPSSPHEVHLQSSPCEGLLDTKPGAAYISQGVHKESTRSPWGLIHMESWGVFKDLFRFPQLVLLLITKQLIM